MANQDKNNKVDIQNRVTGKRDEADMFIDQDRVRERLGFGLRSMYRSVLEEPLPADMMALLEQLDDSKSDDCSPEVSAKDSD